MAALATTTAASITASASALAVSSVQARLADHVMNTWTQLVPRASTDEWEHALNCAFSAVPCDGNAL